MSDRYPISRRAFTGGALLARRSAARPRSAQGFAGLGRTPADFRRVVPGKTFAFPGRSRPASGLSHRVVVRDRQPGRSTGRAYGAQWTLFRQAMQPGAQQEGWANQQIWMGHAAVTRADTHRYQRNLCPRRRRPGRRRGKPVSRLDRFMGDARARSDARRQHRAARTHRVRRGFQLRAAARRRPPAGAAGRWRLQPKIRARPGLVLLQPALFQGDAAASPSTTSRSR